MLVIQPGDVAIFRNACNNRLQKGTPVRTLRNSVQIALEDGTNLKVECERVRLLRAPITKTPVEASDTVISDPPPRVLKIVPTVFERPGTYGDFGAMCHMPEYAHDSVFIYNDNMKCFHDKDFLFPGGGNACIRPFRNRLSMPIPTGEFGGFKTLNDVVAGARAMDHIAEAIRDIKVFLVENPHVVRIFYSAQSYSTPLMGKGIFDVGDEVLVYITHAIDSLQHFF